MRIATYNIRNGRALDPASFWWRRRRALREAMARIDADLWALQEVYSFQRRHLEDTVFPERFWGGTGEGRNGGGRGEQLPIVHRRSLFPEAAATTRWFGPTPNVPRSRAEGARFPRIATVASLTATAGAVLQVANVHLDGDSAERRAAAIGQLVEWIDDPADMPTIVMGDFNESMTEPGFGALLGTGLRSALAADAGPTSNGFGRRLDEQRQIDHVFVSSHFDVLAARIDVESGHASDHYPVVVDLELLGD